MTTDPFAGFKITRLPRRGPKPGQSTASYLRGRANGDREWDKLLNQNPFARRPKRRRKRAAGSPPADS